MSSPIRLLCRTVLLPILWVASSGYAQIEEIPALTLRPAMEIFLPTESGKVYQMQASSDLTSWRDYGKPVFGTGTPILQPMTGGTSQFFRLQIVTAPPMGDTPWSPADTALQLNDGTRTIQYTFLPDGLGSSRPIPNTNSSVIIPFTWTWMRDGLSHARLEIAHPSPLLVPSNNTASTTTTTRESLQLTYAASKTGHFTRRFYVGSQLEYTASGSFGPSPSAATPLVPASIIARTIAFSESPAGSALTLTSVNTGLRLIDATSTPFSGTWLVTGNSTARLTTNFTSTHGEEYRFTFSSPLTGRFTRQTYTEGIFRDDDQGTFCLNMAP